jgi:hypothetical protein
LETSAFQPGQLNPQSILSAEALLWRSRTDALIQLKEIYQRVDRLVAALGPLCLGGGCCCKFDVAGHRLYLSIPELAILIEQPPPALAQARQLRCPYQIGPRCAARPRRSLGCRVFFCDDRLADGLQNIYEMAHGEIRSLAQNLCLPYSYVELTKSLLQIFD